jgi:hypothetical protein
MRQIEETSEHIIVLSGPISFLLASDNFETTLEEVLTENITKNVANRQRATLNDIRKNHGDTARAQDYLPPEAADNCESDVGYGD